MERDQSFQWSKVLRDMAVNAVGILLQGAFFALGSVAVYKVANRASPLPEGNVTPIRKVG